MVEAGGKGLLKSRGYTPKVDSPLASKPGSLKRKRYLYYKKNGCWKGLSVFYVSLVLSGLQISVLKKLAFLPGDV